MSASVSRGCTYNDTASDLYRKMQSDRTYLAIAYRPRVNWQLQDKLWHASICVDMLRRGMQHSWPWSLDEIV